MAGGTITTVAGLQWSSNDGLATGTQLIAPHGVALDSAGNLYFTDRGHDRVRKVAGGVISTVAGNGTRGFSGDNGPAVNAQLNAPNGVAVDSAGNLYIADGGNHRVRRVSADGVIRTVVGNGTIGVSGDNGPATSATLSSPTGVALDSAGNLYIADEIGLVRKVSGGVITTVAGNGTQGFSGDNGPATSAQLRRPYGVAVDSAGEVYIADSGNDRIRKVSAGIITTVAGSGTDSFGGDNGPATSVTLSNPTGVALDSRGNLYIAEFGSYRIRKVSGGMITTLAGWKFWLGRPWQIAVDSTGQNIYVTELDNNTIRRLQAAPP